MNLVPLTSESLFALDKLHADDPEADLAQRVAAALPAVDAVELELDTLDALKQQQLQQQQLLLRFSTPVPAPPTIEAATAVAVPAAMSATSSAARSSGQGQSHPATKAAPTSTPILQHRSISCAFSVSDKPALSKGTAVAALAAVAEPPRRVRICSGGGLASSPRADRDDGFATAAARPPAAATQHVVPTRPQTPPRSHQRQPPQTPPRQPLQLTPDDSRGGHRPPAVLARSKTQPMLRPPAAAAPAAACPSRMTRHSCAGHGRDREAGREAGRDGRRRRHSSAGQATDLEDRQQDGGRDVSTEKPGRVRRNESWHESSGSHSFPPRQPEGAKARPSQHEGAVVGAGGSSAHKGERRRRHTAAGGVPAAAASRRAARESAAAAAILAGVTVAAAPAPSEQLAAPAPAAAAARADSCLRADTFVAAPIEVAPPRSPPSQLPPPPAAELAAGSGGGGETDVVLAAAAQALSAAAAAAAGEAAEEEVETLASGIELVALCAHNELRIRQAESFLHALPPSAFAAEPLYLQVDEQPSLGALMSHTDHRLWMLGERSCEEMGSNKLYKYACMHLGPSLQPEAAARPSLSVCALYGYDVAAEERRRIRIVRRQPDVSA